MPCPGAGTAPCGLVWAAITLDIGASSALLCSALPGLLALPGTAWTLPSPGQGEPCLL